MKKLFALLISLVLVANLFPMSLAMAETQYVEVTESSAPIRDDCYETGNALYWVPRGTMLQVIDSKLNGYLNRWYRVSYDTGYSCALGWIWSGNVKEHKHNFIRYRYNGNTFGVCEGCKTVAVEKVTTVPVKKANALAAAMPAAAAAAALDGPIPVGDIAAGFILVLACLEMNMDVTETEVREWVGEIAIDDYIESDTCSELSFYRVYRSGGLLKKMDGQCLNAFQAFICSRYKGFDVWTMSPEQAYICANMNYGGWYMERDKDRPDYYYHYHYGIDAAHKETDTHVFFGRTETGLEPGF